jgi:hypothetical protein
MRSTLTDSPIRVEILAPLAPFGGCIVQPPAEEAIVVEIPSAIGPPGPQGDPGLTGPTGPPGAGVAIGGSIGQILAKNSATNYDTHWIDYSWTNLSGKPTTLAGYGITDPVALTNAANVFTLNQTLPGLIVPISSSTAKGRVTSLTGVPNWVGYTLNAFYSGGWNLDDTSLDGWILKLGCTAGDSEFAVYQAAPGVNPRPATKVFSVTPGGLMTVTNRITGVGTPTGATDAATKAYADGKEPALGNPSTNGFILSSTAAGVRSWIVPPSGGGGSPGGSNTQVQRNNAGAFGGISGATADATTMTLTSPKIVTNIKDTNANTLLGITATGSAVNYLTLANAATTRQPVLSADGTDSNIGISIQPKGTGWTEIGSSSGLGTTALPVNPITEALAIGWNFSGGFSEIDFLNEYATANELFRFLTSTGIQTVSFYGNAWPAGIGIGGALGSPSKGGLFMPSGDYVSWNADTALYRNTAGILEINNGTAGSYRDLKLRTLSLTGATTVNISAPATLTGGFLKDDGTWAVPPGGGSGSPGGSNTQVQYNNAGAFGGSSTFTYNGTQVLVPPGTFPTAPGLAIGNSTTGLYTSVNDFFIVSGGDWHARINNAGLLLNDVTTSKIITWYGTGTPDIALNRNAAGILEINNGTTGTYRDLKLRTLLLNPGAAPTGVEGALYGNSTDHKIYYHNGTSFIDLTAGGGGGGNVSNSGTPSAGQIAAWTDATHIQGIANTMSQWDGGATGLVAATGRNSLGGTTVGQNFFTLTNPSAITFPRINADNSVSALDAATFRTAIGAGTSSFDGTFTSLTGKPTTLAGYGITDAYTKTQADARYELALGNPSTNGFILSSTAAGVRSWIAPAAGGVTSVFTRTGAVVADSADYSAFYALISHTHTFASLTAKPTTLAGYGITDAQPLDADLTAIAALTTTSFGRGFLTQADAAASRTYIGAGTSSFDGTWTSLTGKPTTLVGYGITDAQPLDADLTAIAALTPTANKFLIGNGTAWVNSTPAWPNTVATVNKIIKSNGTTGFVASTETYAAPGTSGNHMVSDGTNWISAAQTSAIPGTTTNDNAATGNIGETVSSYIPFASGVGYTTGQTKNLTSISLTAGDWDVRGVTTFFLNGLNLNALFTFVGQITTTTGTITDDGAQSYGVDRSSGASSTPLVTCALPSRRISLTSTTTVYLVAKAPNFSAGGVSVNGYIEARRMR